MKSSTVSIVASIVVWLNVSAVSGEEDRVFAKHRQLSDSISSPCDLVRCPGDLPRCVVLDNGTVQCEKDPCVELICNAASTCEVDAEGNAYCLPLPGNPGNEGEGANCAAVTCPIDAPICIINAEGTADCIKDPCAELICNAASTCEVDAEGNAYCLPLPGNPGNEGANPDTKPDWWDYVSDNFDGARLSRCKRLKNVPPITGASCNGKRTKTKPLKQMKQMKQMKQKMRRYLKAKKKQPKDAKNERTCFFGNQECRGIGSYPDTKCECIDGEWNCDSKLDCPTI